LTNISKYDIFKSKIESSTFFYVKFLAKHQKRREKMEAKIYFKREPAVMNRLKEAGMIKDGKESPVYDFFRAGIGGGMLIIAKECPEFVYLKADNIMDIEVPEVFRGLDVAGVTISDVLLKEENDHIAQGAESKNKTAYSVTYADEKFEPPTKCEFSNASAYRSLVKIWVKSTDVQAAIDCYNRIREGKTSNKWKGNHRIPSHCKLSV
jgi:hypothetical protein